MNEKQIFTLIKQFESSSIRVLELEYENVKIKLSKYQSSKYDINGNNIEVKNPKSKEKKIEGYEVRSPLIGVFYESSSPGSIPFVKVGDRVKVGQPLCIIEEMKIMNEITSPIEGVIEDIVAKNTNVVKKDQLLMVIKPNK